MAEVTSVEGARGQDEPEGGIASYFGFRERGTTMGTEIRAGLTRLHQHVDSLCRGKEDRFRIAFVGSGRLEDRARLPDLRQRDAIARDRQERVILQ